MFLQTINSAAPQGAVLLSADDGPTFALWYNRFTLGYRTDIDPLDVRLLAHSWYRDNVAHWLPNVAQALQQSDFSATLAALAAIRPVCATRGDLLHPPGYRWSAGGPGLWCLQQIP